MSKDINDLPQEWIKGKLPEISNIIMGQSPSSKTYSSLKVGIPFFQGKAEFGEIYPIVGKYCSEPLKIAQAEDVLISIRAPVGPTNLCKEESCIGRGLAAIRPMDKIPSKYIFYYFRNIEEWLSKQGTGSTFTAIRKSDLEEIEIPIPPLNEQRRIVAKLEVLLGKVDACITRLEKIPFILKRFRELVLSMACDGRLTADWRERNKDLPNATEIVKNLYQQRVSIVTKEADQEKLKVVYQYKESNDAKYLPRNWTFVALNKLCESFDYGSSNKSQPSGKIPVLRMGNIQDGKIDWNKLVYTSNEKEIQKYALKPRTVLFNRTNSPELVGKTAIYRGEAPAIFAGYLIRVNNYPILDADYLNYCLNTNYAKDFCLKEKTDGVSQSNINAQKLGKFEVPFCSLYEQQEIVRRVESLFKLADQIENRYQKAKAYVDKLTQSILDKAFCGELVPQDPNDEPASVLLERIKKEKLENKTQEEKNKTIQKPKIIKRKVSKSMVSKNEVKQTHLQDILKEASKALSPMDLWRKSGLEIDDFYSQLKDEVDRGTIIEVQPNNTDRYLEVKL